jgi:type I restriction enzyme S subunit
MIGAWEVSTLGKICTFKSGDGFKKELQGQTTGDIPFVKVSDFSVVGNELFIQQANNWLDAAATSAYTVHPPGAVLFAKIGIALTYNRRRRLVRPTIADNNMMTATPRTVDAVWFYYLLCTMDFNQISSGSALPYLTVKDLSAMPVSIPTRNEQEAIADVLSALDDKIELNRRMNETLEASARALFRDWFVDFGPTRAKAEDHPAYLAPDIWSLFPATLDAEGKPEGWRDGVFSDIAKAVNQKADPNEIDAETPYIGLEHMPRQSVALDQWEGAGKVSSAKSSFQAGHILFGKLRPYFHKVGIAPVSGICSTDIVVMEARRPELAALALACASTEEFVAYSDQSSTGTKMPRTSWSIMGTYPLVQADKPVNVAFENLVGPMIETIRANIHESRALAETRDLLLPKLMSGEIRVAQAEKLAGDHL